MRFPVSAIRIYLIGLVVLAVPVAAAFYLADYHSLREQEEHAAELATDVLRRAHRVSGQIDNAVKALTEAGGPEPCSDANLRLMSRTSAENPYLVATGYVHQDRLMCSAFGTHGAGIALGPPTLRSKLGNPVWNAVRLPGISDHEFMVTVDGASGYAAILARNGPIAVESEDPDAIHGLYNLRTRRVMAAHGDFQPDWAEHLGEQPHVQFFDGAFVVALKRSDHYDYAAYAAIPANRLHEGWISLIFVLVPLGVGAGILLALLMLRYSRYQSSLPAQLKQGLKNNELFLVYQPIVELASGRWVGAEALLRWRRPNGEMVPPDIFIPIAENNDLMDKVTTRVVALFAEDAAHLLQAHPGFYIALNLSARDFETQHVMEHLHRALTQWNIAPGGVHVEVTERLLVNSQASRRGMQALRDMGIQIALDDFGTGYSSLSYLTTLPLDYIKIDKSFVDTIGTGAVTSEVVAHIIEIGKSLKLGMIAEGVETAAQADYLRAHGVQFAQGWLFSRPMDITLLTNGIRGQATPPAGAT